MRNRVVLLGFLCLTCVFPALADAIVLSPNSINLFDAETQVTVSGPTFGPGASTVTYNGPAGIFTVDGFFLSPTSLLAAVPAGVANIAGTYQVTVSTDTGAGFRIDGPANFSVVNTTPPQPPLLGLPEVVVAEATSPSGAVVNYTVTAISFVDPSATVNCSPASGLVYPLGTSIVSCTATDSFGSSRGSFPILVTDTTPPVMSVPGNIFSNDPVVTFSATANDAIDGTVPVTCNPPSGSTFPNGVTIVTCTAVDAHFNRGIGTFTVTIGGNPPVLTLPANISVTTTNPAGTVVNYTATADQGTVTCNPPSGSVFPVNVTAVLCSATSAFGTTNGSFSVTVTLVISTPPTLNLPADIVREATGPAGAMVAYVATATDSIDGNIPVTCTPASGSTFAIGTTLVQCSATNSNSQTTNGSFNVTVRDTTPPTLTLPANITKEATGPSGAVVTYTASANDIVDGAVTPTCSPASGSTFALGITTVQCSATDAHGNRSNGSFTVTVQDTTPPQVAHIEASPNLIWPPNHKMVSVSVTVVAVDTVDPAPVSRIISVTSSQPVNGNGDGNTSPDWTITGPLTVDLRAERAQGQDRLYTITVETSDFSGNKTQSTVTVLVSHSRRR
jgi:hypothetical protein